MHVAVPFVEALRHAGAAAILAMSDAEYMNSAQLRYFRETLLKRKTDAMATRMAATDMAGCEVTPDPVDRASAEEAHALALGVNERETAKIVAIDRALGRIESGDYGWCEDTGDMIGIARLLAEPTASLTVEAKERRERQTKFTRNKH